MYLVWLTPTIVLAVCALILLIRHCVKGESGGMTKTNIDSIIGEKCVVTEKIDNFAGCGQAKVKGQVWSARGLYDDDEFEVGETLRIVAIEGVKIICKKD